MVLRDSLIARAAPLLAALLLCLLPCTARAVEFKVSGVWQVLFEDSNVQPRGVKNADTFGAVQRFRTQLDAVVSENLSGSVQFELGRTEWGQASTGGALGADGKIVELRYAWLDWTLPDTDLKVRMGLQSLMLPGVLAGTSAVFAQDMAGVSLNAPLWENENSEGSLSAFWARPYNDNSINYSHNEDTLHLDNLDVFALSVPMRWQGFSLNPWAMYALIGKYSLSGLQVSNEPAIVAPRGGLTPVFGNGQTYVNFQNSHLSSLDRPWGDGIWLGLDVQAMLGSDFELSLEGTYGYVDMGSVENYRGFGGEGRTFHLRREGWFAGAKLEYLGTWGIPGILAWYGSGDDDNPWNGSERLPQFNSPWMVTSLGFGASPIDEASWKVLGSNPGGMMAAIAQVRNLSFIDRLSHKIALAGYVGTNSPKMPRKAHMSWPTRADGPMAYLTTMDTAWEANFRSDYKIYENLTINLDAAYARLNLNDSVWRGGDDSQKKDNYRVSLLFTYSF